MTARTRHLVSTCILVLVAAAFGASAGQASALAAEPCPTRSVYKECAAGWEITTDVEPTNIAPGHRGEIEVYLFNVGADNTETGSPVTVTDTLPEGVKALRAGESVYVGSEPDWSCTVSGRHVTCETLPEKLETWLGGGVGLDIDSGKDTPVLRIEVEATGVPRTAVNVATVSGGDAVDSASTNVPIVISEAPASFGVANWDVWFSNANGTPDTQAGSHPYTATFALQVNTALAPGYEELYELPEVPLDQYFFKAAGGEMRNATVDLPPGLVGNPTAVPQCPRDEFDAESGNDVSDCPADTVIGIANAISGAVGTEAYPIFNLVPPPGVAAQFGFNETSNPVYIDSTVDVGSDDHIVTRAVDNPQARAVSGAIVTLWGVPGDSSHDSTRCAVDGGDGLKECASGAGTVPLLTLPTTCGAPPTFTATVNTWETPVKEASKTSTLHDPNGTPTGLTGCEKLNFDPHITTDPDTQYADTPAGLTVEVSPSTGGLAEPTGNSTADIQDTAVILPQGFVINPGQAAGLQACRIGSGDGSDELPLPGENGEEERFDGPARCPNASKVGTVDIQSPLIEGGAEKQFEGNVYLLASNPPELKLLIAASANGVNLKLIGNVHLDEQTGQISTTFTGTPELPFTHFKLSFSGGSQAALATPTHCGAYTVSSDFTAWGGPLVSDAFPTGEFAIVAGSGGSACPVTPAPFAPTLTAGSSTDHAGAFTSFSMLLQRGDGQQRIEMLQFRVPPGLAGIISSVPLCGEPQAAQGTCPASSQVGHASVASGPGPYPLVLPQPGAPELPIYLTGPYDGAPFGLSIVTPVIAGPFNLGTIVTRAKIEVDPHTAQITVTTDPLPQIVKGVPTDLRQVQATIDRPGFMFNPTNCAPASFAGTAWGTAPPGLSEPGETAAISSPFGMGGCKELEFKPKFVVSTPGRTSKADGAGLSVKLSYPTAAQGTQTNITRVKVDLPKQLPSRLTTLQKACTNVQFEADPANCPAASKIGMATVTTPVLPVPLVGPAIFVSHGGEAFPSLTMVLQGDNVTVDLVGTTFISKAGVTSTTFKTVPDVPFNTFTLTLPQGEYSALAANVPAKDHYSLCGQKLAMPTEFLAQNGAKINQSTPISVSGCATAKALTRTQKLAGALKACHKDRKKAKREQCEKLARKRYGAVKTKKKTKQR
jgi:hypothetical protein